MPLTPVGAQGVLAPALLATGMLGLATPRFALGIGTGISKWIKTVPVTTVDAGSLGVGSGQLPLVVPQPVLLANILTSMASMGIKGPMAPLFALGLATGLTGAFAQGLIKTTHPGIGTGTGVAKFGPIPAPPLIIAGLAEVGMAGPTVIPIATAIGMALNKTFAALTLPVPIVGSASPAGGAGVGSGVVI